jgi:hypothetical protein
MKIFRIAAYFVLPVMYFLAGAAGPAFAQDITQGAQAQPHSGWGAGPLMVPLVVAVRHEGPVKGDAPHSAVAAAPVALASLSLPAKEVAAVRSALALNEALSAARNTVAAHTGREIALASD